MASVINQTYGSALFDLATESNSLEEVNQAYAFVVATLQAQPEYLTILNSPQLGKDHKKSSLESVFGSEIPKILLHFLKLLIDKNRFYYVFDIQGAFVEFYNELHNIEIATLYSAKPLSSEEEAKVVKMLEEKTKKKIKLVCKIDETLIAGLRIKVKDQVLDNTVLTRLQNLKKQVRN